MKESKKIQKRTLVGTVRSNKMQKAVTVRVINKKLHPLYRKVVKQYRSYMAKNEFENVKVGDQVRITETRPLSKKIRWVVTEVLES